MVDEAKIAEINAKFREREEFIRESWVRSMARRLVSEELGKCHRGEGVNHYENCKWLAEKYLLLMRDNKLKGYKVIDV